MKNIVVVKCGGSTIQELSDEFFQSIKYLQSINIKPVIVHGGGPEINRLLKKLEVDSEFVNGLRKTTTEVLEVAEMVLTGKVNKFLVTKLQGVGVTSLGLSGCDGQLLQAKAIDHANLGYVGEVIRVNQTLLRQLIDMSVIPVIAPIGIDEKGNHYNINADTAAGAIAESLEAKQMIFATDVAGIMKGSKLQPIVTIEEIEEMILDGTIYGGMIPKVKAAINCLQGKIEEVFIVNGIEGKLTSNGDLIGTKIVKSKQLNFA